MKRKSVRIYSFTGTGSCLALKLAEKLKQEGYVCTGYTVARFAEDKRLTDGNRKSGHPGENMHWYLSGRQESRSVRSLRL